jgi:hypothetical protein
VSNALAGHQQVQHVRLLDDLHGLLVRAQRHVVAIALQDLVVDSQTSPVGCRVLGHVRHVHAVVGVALRGLGEVLVDAAADLEATPRHLLALLVDGRLFLEGDGNAQALEGREEAVLAVGVLHVGGICGDGRVGGFWVRLVGEKFVKFIFFAAPFE